MRRSRPFSAVHLDYRQRNGQLRWRSYLSFSSSLCCARGGQRSEDCVRLLQVTVMKFSLFFHWRGGLFLLFSVSFPGGWPVVALLLPNCWLVVVFAVSLLSCCIWDVYNGCRLPCRCVAHFLRVWEHLVLHRDLMWSNFNPYQRTGFGCTSKEVQ